MFEIDLEHGKSWTRCREFGCRTPPDNRVRCASVKTEATTFDLEANAVLILFKNEKLLISYLSFHDNDSSSE